MSAIREMIDRFIQWLRRRDVEDTPACTGAHERNHEAYTRFEQSGEDLRRIIEEIKGL